MILTQLIFRALQKSQILLRKLPFFESPRTQHIDFLFLKYLYVDIFYDLETMPFFDVYCMSEHFFTKSTNMAFLRPLWGITTWPCRTGFSAHFGHGT